MIEKIENKKINLEQYQIICILFALGIIFSIAIGQTTLMIIVIISFILYVAFVGVNNGKAQKEKSIQLIDDGKMIKRDSDFYRRKYTYICNVSDFNEITKIIDLDILNEFSIEYIIDLSKQWILFANRYSDGLSKGSFKAVFRKTGMIENQNSYEFYLAEWKDNDIWKITDQIPANILLTAIEKSLLKLDENTKYNYKYLKLTIK